MDDRKFEVFCDASPQGRLQVKSRALSVAISQSVQRNKIEEIWQSVLIICEQNPDGLLTTRIIVCHPDWDQNLQIACIRSRSAGEDGLHPEYEVDLKTVQV